MFRRLLEWWRKPAKHSYGVYARGRRIATAVTAEDADQYIKETFNEIMSQEQRSRKGFGGTHNTTRRQQWQAYRNQFQIKRLPDE